MLIKEQALKSNNKTHFYCTYLILETDISETALYTRNATAIPDPPGPMCENKTVIHFQR